MQTTMFRELSYKICFWYPIKLLISIHHSYRSNRCDLIRSGTAIPEFSGRHDICCRAAQSQAACVRHPCNALI